MALISLKEYEMINTAFLCCFLDEYSMKAFRQRYEILQFFAKFKISP